MYLFCAFRACSIPSSYILLSFDNEMLLCLPKMLNFDGSGNPWFMMSSSIGVVTWWSMVKYLASVKVQYQVKIFIFIRDLSPADYRALLKNTDSVL